MRRHSDVGPRLDPTRPDPTSSTPPAESHPGFTPSPEPASDCTNWSGWVLHPTNVTHSIFRIRRSCSRSFSTSRSSQSLFLLPHYYLSSAWDCPVCYSFRHGTYGFFFALAFSFLHFDTSCLFFLCLHWDTGSFSLLGITTSCIDDRRLFTFCIGLNSGSRYRLHSYTFTVQTIGRKVLHHQMYGYMYQQQITYQEQKQSVNTA